MDIDPNFGLPTESDVFEEIAKSEQHVKVITEKRRYGKPITLVTGISKNLDIKAIAKTLKEKLACGGTIKGDIIELQGNHQKLVRPLLVKLGFPNESISD